MTSGARYSAVPQNVVVVSFWPIDHVAFSSPFIQCGDAGEAGGPSRNSPRDPDGVGGAVMAAVRRGNSFERPKSVSTMWPSAPMRMFSGFRSR